MTTGEDTHGCDYFTLLFLLPQLCNSTVHTVIRWMSNRRQMETMLSPFARAVLIASTWLSVRGVLARRLGFATTLGSSSTASCGSSPTPSFARSHAEPSRSNLCQVFGLSPPASTSSIPAPVHTAGGDRLTHPITWGSVGSPKPTRRGVDR